MAAAARSPLATVALILMLPAAAQEAPPPATSPPAATAKAANGCRGGPLPDAAGLDTMCDGLLFWADGPQPSDRCDACLGGSIGFEVLFGNACDHALRRNRAPEALPRQRGLDTLSPSI